MPTAGPRRSRQLGFVARCAAAALLALLQLTVLIAPLAEVVAGHDAVAGSARVAPRVGAPETPPGRHQAPHDETTCPACIARSLHAAVEGPLLQPTSRTEQRSTPDLHITLPTLQQLPPAHPSRAPPVAG